MITRDEIDRMLIKYLMETNMELTKENTLLKEQLTTSMDRLIDMMRARMNTNMNAGLEPIDDELNTFIATVVNGMK